MLFSHTGKGGMTCAIEQHPGRGHGTRPRHIEDGTPAECCVAGPGSCSPRRGRLVRKDIVMRLALRKRFACPACQLLVRRDGPTAVGKAVEIIWAFLNRLSKMPAYRGKTRRNLAYRKGDPGATARVSQRLRQGQSGCDFGLVCDARARRHWLRRMFRVAVRARWIVRRRIVWHQSTDDSREAPHNGALRRACKAFYLPTYAPL